MAKYSEEFKKETVAKFEAGTSIKELAKETGASESTIRNWSVKYATVKGILSQKKQEVTHKQINKSIDEIIERASEINFVHKPQFILLLRTLYVHEDESSDVIRVKKETLDSYTLDVKLTDEELVNNISNLLYDNFIQSINVIKDLVNATSGEETEALVVNTFKNFEDAGNRSEIYTEVVRSLSRELYTLYETEKANATDSEYVIKYITPILIPVLLLDVDVVNFGSKLNDEDLLLYLEEAVSQANELLNFYQEENNSINEFVERLTTMTFNNKKEFVSKHINEMISYVNRNKTLFNPQSIYTLDKILKQLNYLIDKSKKKDLKIFLNDYVLSVIAVALNFNQTTEDIIKKHEVEYINYFVNYVTSKGVLI